MFLSMDNIINIRLCLQGLVSLIKALIDRSDTSSILVSFVDVQIKLALIFPEAGSFRSV